MRHSIKTGVSFGITSGIITTLGLMVGLNSGTHSQLAVIGGILTIAIADACSDALGIHVSEEAENKHNTREIWESTISTFLAKLIIASSFIIPFLIIDFNTAIIVNGVWGLSLLSLFSYYISRGTNSTPWKVVGEHLVIAIVVIIMAHYIGTLISSTFGQVQSI